MMKGKKYNYVYGLFIFFLVMSQACNGEGGPKPIRYGKDQCVFCKMTVSDPRFGTQIMTKKGKAFNFDDVSCMIAYVKKGHINREDVAEFYLPDYANDNKLLPAKDLFYLKSEELKSPMRGDVAAFASKNDLEKAIAQYGGEVLTWDDIWK